MEYTEEELEQTVENSRIVIMTAQLVASYVSKNPISVQDMIRMISDVHATLRGVAESDDSVGEGRASHQPAVAIEDSITGDYLICLEDGRRYKSLRRHLATTYKMTPEQYRKKWRLPPDYPMVAPNYSKQRSNLARKFRLGKRAD